MDSVPDDYNEQPGAHRSGGRWPEAQPKKKSQPRPRVKGRFAPAAAPVPQPVNGAGTAAAVPESSGGGERDVVVRRGVARRPDDQFDPFLDDEDDEPEVVSARNPHGGDRPLDRRDSGSVAITPEDRAREGIPRDLGLPALDLGLGTLPPAEAPLPELRRKQPEPVIPWHLRAQRRFRELTQPGRVEAEANAVIAALLARPALTSGCRTIAVLGAKGGAGKSTTALALGLVLGTYDAAKPVVMEVNPDLGNVRQLLPSANPRTVQDLLEGLIAAERGGVNRVQGYLTMWGRLGVLTAPQRPDEMARLAPRDYARTLRLLKLYFGTVILDCGTSFTNRLQQWAIQTADHLVLVTPPEEAPLRTTLTAIDYLASAAYAEDYRGVFREVADAAGAEGAGVRGTRERRDMTLVVNGVGFAGRRDAVDLTKVRAAAEGLNDVIVLPYSAELRQRINDGVLTPEVLPVAYRRAIKGGLAAALGRLAEV